jgi:hypothetical protein
MVSNQVGVAGVDAGTAAGTRPQAVRGVQQGLDAGGQVSVHGGRFLRIQWVC